MYVYSLIISQVLIVFFCFHCSKRCIFTQVLLDGWKFNLTRCSWRPRHHAASSKRKTFSTTNRCATPYWLTFSLRAPASSRCACSKNSHSVTLRQTFSHVDTQRNHCQLTDQGCKVPIAVSPGRAFSLELGCLL